MAEEQSTPPPAPLISGDKQTDNKQAGAEKDPEQDKASAVVELIVSIALVFWVFSEILEAHEFKKLMVLAAVDCMFMIGVGHALYKLSKSIKTASISWVSTAILVAVVVYGNLNSPAFKIVPRGIFVSKEKPYHFISWRPNGVHVISPIEVEMRIEFTNLREKAMTVNSLQFEGKLANGKWEVMPIVITETGPMIWFTGTNWIYNGIGKPVTLASNTVVLMKELGKTTFPYLLNGRMINSGETIIGEIFLELPKDGFTGQMRCRLIDSLDGELLENVSAVTQERALSNSERITAEVTLWKSPDTFNDAIVRKYSKGFDSD
jgi:hypothetical protein